MLTSPGALLAPREEEVSGVKPGGAWHQPYRGAGAQGPGPSLRDTTAQNEAGASALGAGWTALPRESAVKRKSLW